MIEIDLVTNINHNFNKLKKIDYYLTNFNNYLKVFDKNRPCITNADAAESTLLKFD